MVNNHRNAVKIFFVIGGSRSRWRTTTSHRRKGADRLIPAQNAARISGRYGQAPAATDSS